PTLLRGIARATTEAEGAAAEPLSGALRSPRLSRRPAPHLRGYPPSHSGAILAKKIRGGFAMRRADTSVATIAAAIAALLGGFACSQAAAQTQAAMPGAVPAETTAAAYVDPSWKAPRTSWGDPSLEGVWSTDDRRSVPLNRPERFGTRTTLTPDEFAERVRSDQSGRETAAQGSFLQHEWGVRTFGYTSLVIDPPNGRMPEQTSAGLAL